MLCNITPALFTNPITTFLPKFQGGMAGPSSGGGGGDGGSGPPVLRTGSAHDLRSLASRRQILILKFKEIIGGTSLKRILKFKMDLFHKWQTV